MTCSPLSERVPAVLAAHAKAAGLAVWLVGGTVRDTLLGRPSSDLDAVVATPDRGQVRALTAAIARELGQPWFTLSREFGGERIVWEGGHLDVSPLRGRSIQEDLGHRDFTINAIALPVDGGAPVDPFGGLSDLEKRRLVLVHPAAFRADPARLMRAVRFSRTHALTLDPHLVQAARTDAHLIREVAPERILTEVAATLAEEGTAEAARLWGELGILPYVFPEVAALEGVGQSTNHRHDVLGHTLEALDHVDAILRNPERRFPEAASAVRERLSRGVDGVFSRPAALRFAVLLHDIAKPQTRHVDELGRLSFWGHEAEGVPMARSVCERLRGSAALTRLVARVVEGHLWLGFLQNRKPLWVRDEIEYLWKARPWEPEVIIASVADRLATRGPMTADRFVWRHLTLARHLMWRWQDREENGVPPLPLGGDEVARVADVEPGPRLGRLLAALRLEWEAGELPEREDVVARARSLARELAEE